MSTHANRSGLRPISVTALSDELPSSYPHELVKIVEVANGQRVTVRPVLSLDAAKFQEFVAGLSKTSRAHRFMGGLRELPLRLLDQLTRIDYRSHMALVAETQHDGMPIIIAEARYAVDRCSDSAELAVAVADEWQGLGLAKALRRRLIGHAAAVGLRRWPAMPAFCTSLRRRGSRSSQCLGSRAYYSFRETSRRNPHSRRGRRLNS